MDKIAAEHWDIVGFQILAFNRTSSFRLIEEIHQHRPDIHLVAGGVHATVMYEQIVLRYPFLTVVRGEGEMTISELADKWSGGGGGYGFSAGDWFFRRWEACCY